MAQDNQILNISEKYKYIWWGPERTGSRTVAEVLSYFDFKRGGMPIYQAGQHDYRHTCYMPDSVKDYGLICSARNPYARTLSIFTTLFPSYTDKSVDGFKKFIKYHLNGHELLRMIASPIFTKIPDYIIRLEYLKEDFMKLPFLNDVLSERHIDMMIQHGKEKVTWEDYYDDETKEIVYGFTKHHFNMFKYEK